MHSGLLPLHDHKHLESIREPFHLHHIYWAKLSRWVSRPNKLELRSLLQIPGSMCRLHSRSCSRTAPARHIHRHREQTQKEPNDLVSAIAIQRTTISSKSLRPAFIPDEIADVNPRPVTAHPQTKVKVSATCMIKRTSYSLKRVRLG